MGTLPASTHVHDTTEYFTIHRDGHDAWYSLGLEYDTLPRPGSPEALGGRRRIAPLGVRGRRGEPLGLPVSDLKDRRDSV